MISMLIKLGVFFLMIAESVVAATTITYTYDGLGRVESAIRTDGLSHTYTYDAVGSMTARSLTNPDTDGDTLSDAWETAHGLSPNDPNDAMLDPDGDGLTNQDEHLAHTNPHDWDSDNDGISDKDEVDAGTDPLTSYTIFTADGDLNNDGFVNAGDVMLGYRILFGEIAPTFDQRIRMDVAPLVNGIPAPDGQLNLGDILVIQRAAIGQVSFPLR